VGTSTTAAALQLASEARVPLFAPLTGAQSLREPFNRYLAHVRASAWDEAAAIVKQTSAVGIQRVAVYHHDDADGQAGLEGMRRALSKAKLEPVSVGVMPAGSAELSALVANALSARAEAVVVVAPYKQTAVFVRLARKGGFMGTIYTLSSVGTQALLDELGAVASGVAVTQVVPFPYTPTNSLSAEYLAELKTDDARGLSPNYASMEGYVAAKVFTEVARRMRAPSREGFLAALQGLSQLTLGNLNLSYGPVRNAGSTFVEITLLTKDGNVRR
jgi:ABC-type branched-subunit amino acid transport system substrate-binding protein